MPFTLRDEATVVFKLTEIVAMRQVNAPARGEFYITVYTTGGHVFELNKVSSERIVKALDRGDLGWL